MWINIIAYLLIFFTFVAKLYYVCTVVDAGSAKLRRHAA